MSVPNSYSTDRELMQACLALLDEIGAEPAIPWWTYKRGVDLRVALKTRLESDAPSGPSVPSEKERITWHACKAPASDGTISSDGTWTCRTCGASSDSPECRHIEQGQNAAPQESTDVRESVKTSKATEGRTSSISAPAVAAPDDKLEHLTRITTAAENLRILAARLDEHLSPAEKRELADAAAMLDAAQESNEAWCERWKQERAQSATGDAKDAARWRAAVAQGEFPIHRRGAWMHVLRP